MVTVETRGNSIYKEKGSKFIGIALHASTKEEVETALQSIKDEYPDARHVCYAYRLGAKGDEYRANDDGEPSGSAGQPILRQITSFEATDTIVAVIRYFGGTKLGVGGLISAYKIAAKEALMDAKLTARMEWIRFQLTTTYEQVGQVQQLINREKLTPLATDTADVGMAMDFKLDKAKFDRLAPLMQKLGTLSLE